MDLIPIEDALKAATPGPWLHRVWYGNDDGGWAAVGPWHSGDEDTNCDTGCEPDCDHYKQAGKDASLIANAPTWLTQLVAEVKALRDAIHGIANDCTEADTERVAYEHAFKLAGCD